MLGRAVNASPAARQRCLPISGSRWELTLNRPAAVPSGSCTSQPHVDVRSGHVTARTPRCRPHAGSALPARDGRPPPCHRSGSHDPAPVVRGSDSADQPAPAPPASGVRDSMPPIAEAAVRQARQRPSIVPRRTAVTTSGHSRPCAPPSCPNAPRGRWSPAFVPAVGHSGARSGASGDTPGTPPLTPRWMHPAVRDPGDSQPLRDAMPAAVRASCSPRQGPSVGSRQGSRVDGARGSKDRK
jgi:hypothetical protein